MHLSDFHFTLPPELIAQYPLPKRTDSKLMCLAKQQFIHRQFYELIELIDANDLLIFNNTRVLPARLIGQKSTGGRVEALVERIIDDKRMIAQLRMSKSPRVGDVLSFSPYHLRIVAHHERFFELALVDTSLPLLEVLHLIGKMPIPPYLKREAEEQDKERYQTVYAKHLGSVAAPTAGLHFTEELLQQLRDKKIDIGELTLHVGAGTFLPVREDNIQKHQMHAEYFAISATLCEQIAACRERNGRIIAVGTTTLRALESASVHGKLKPYQGETSIFIYPGFVFNCIDVLITNFHLPGSTLLMLVSAFGGHAYVMRAYQTAVNLSYRFFSYGDAMWVEKAI